MKLNFRNFNDAQIPNDTYAALVFSLFVSMGAIVLSNQLGKRERKVYTVRLRDFNEPKNTVYKMPGIYVTEEQEERMTYEDDEDA